VIPAILGQDLDWFIPGGIRVRQPITNIYISILSLSDGANPGYMDITGRANQGCKWEASLCVHRNSPIGFEPICLPGIFHRSIKRFLDAGEML
jgi:hypothetical protein